MLLTITTTHRPASDLGYLLYKNPSGAQSFELPFGKAHVFYPHASEELCTAALLLDIDTVELTRAPQGRPQSSVENYVNDRPYVASSFLSVAIAQVLGSALNGKSRERQELADTAIPLTAMLTAVPSRGGEQILRRLFEPLGYAVQVEPHPLDDKFQDWGQSQYFTLTLEKTCLLRDLLTHLYVLIPVLDNNKHYAVGDDEVEKLLRRGEGWLSQHPDRNLITSRYLKHRKRLTRVVLKRLAEDDPEDVDEIEAAHAVEEQKLEERISLNQQRMNSVLSVLKSIGASSVIDMGCGEGKLIGSILAEKQFSRVVGIDVSFRSLEIAKRKLRFEDMPDRQKSRIELLHGSLTYRDSRFTGFDAATCIEVIEHLDLYRLSAFERVLFEFAQPKNVIVTTPNVEYNARFETLPAGEMRHKDHRFEWTRAEFRQWAEGVAQRHKYNVRFLPVGDEDPELGAPTQMGVFTR